MKMRYLLDTNICIYIAKRNPQNILKKFEKLTVGEAGMSVITYGELLYGAKKSVQADRSVSMLKQLATYILPVDLNHHVCECYGEIRAQLEKQGKPIGNNDLWIAAHARALEITLVTNNMKEFARVPLLKIENWV